MKSYITLSAPHKDPENKTIVPFCLMIHNIVSFAPLGDHQGTEKTRVKCVGVAYNVIETCGQIMVKLDDAAKGL
jgi:hypothetical protein